MNWRGWKVCRLSGGRLVSRWPADGKVGQVAQLPGLAVGSEGASGRTLGWNRSSTREHPMVIRMTLKGVGVKLELFHRERRHESEQVRGLTACSQACCQAVTKAHRTASSADSSTTRKGAKQSDAKSGVLTLPAALAVTCTAPARAYRYCNREGRRKSLPSPESNSKVAQSATARWRRASERPTQKRSSLGQMHGIDVVNDFPLSQGKRGQLSRTERKIHGGTPSWPQEPPQERRESHGLGLELKAAGPSKWGGRGNKRGRWVWLEAPRRPQGLQPWG